MSQPTPALTGPQAQPPSSIGPRILLAITLLLAAVFWLAIFGQMLFLAPKTAQVLMEFKSRIPWFVERVIDDSWWVMPLIGFAAFGVCLAIRKRWAWNFALLILPLLLNLVVCLSLLVPTLQMLSGLSARLAAGP